MTKYKEQEKTNKTSILNYVEKRMKELGYRYNIHTAVWVLRYGDKEVHCLSSEVFWECGSRKCVDSMIRRFCHEVLEGWPCNSVGLE